jgi:hypothetical protein
MAMNLFIISPLLIKSSSGEMDTPDILFLYGGIIKILFLGIGSGLTVRDTSYRSTSPMGGNSSRPTGSLRYPPYFGSDAIIFFKGQRKLW